MKAKLRNGYRVNSYLRKQIKKLNYVLKSLMRAIIMLATPESVIDTITGVEMHGSLKHKYIISLLSMYIKRG